MENVYHDKEFYIFLVFLPDYLFRFIMKLVLEYNNILHKNCVTIHLVLTIEICLWSMKEHSVDSSKFAITIIKMVIWELAYK